MPVPWEGERKGYGLGREGKGATGKPNQMWGKEAGTTGTVLQSQMRSPRAWQWVLATAEVRSRTAGATGGLQPLCRHRERHVPPRVSAIASALSARLAGKRNPRFGDRVLSRGCGRRGAVARQAVWQHCGRTEPYPLANGPGAAGRAGRVLRATVSGRLGLGTVRLWDSEELMSEIQLPVI